MPTVLPLWNQACVFFLLSLKSLHPLSYKTWYLQTTLQNLSSKSTVTASAILLKCSSVGEIGASAIIGQALPNVEQMQQISMCLRGGLFSLEISEHKHEHKHKKKKKFLSLCLYLCLCLRQGHFHCDIRAVLLAFVLSLVLASLVKTRLKLYFWRQFFKQIFWQCSSSFSLDCLGS